MYVIFGSMITLDLFFTRLKLSTPERLYVGYVVRKIIIILPQIYIYKHIPSTQLFKGIQFEPLFSINISNFAGSHIIPNSISSKLTRKYLSASFRWKSWFAWIYVAQINCGLPLGMNGHHAIPLIAFCYSNPSHSFCNYQFTSFFSFFALLCAS
jgi:hypothetical protein